MSEFSSFTKHKLFPWTIKQDKLREGLENSISRTRFTRHIVAVGDLHGDMGNARKVLQFAGVVDDMGDWTGDVDFFVQTGDIIDRCVFVDSCCYCSVGWVRGDDTIALFTWMEKLRAQTHETGGIMLSLLGNHEWMNAIGNLLPSLIPF